MVPGCSKLRELANELYTRSGNLFLRIGSGCNSTPFSVISLRNFGSSYAGQATTTLILASRSDSKNLVRRNVLAVIPYLIKIKTLLIHWIFHASIAWHWESTKLSIHFKAAMKTRSVSSVILLIEKCFRAIVDASLPNSTLKS